MLLALVLSCAPQPSGAVLAACEEAKLEPGELRVCRMVAGQAPAGSGGRAGDWRLQNAVLDLVVRDDYTVLTRLEGAGGTLIGANLPGSADVLLELIPTLPGGWFDKVAIDGIEGQGWVGLRLEGTDASGSAATLEYRLEPDSPTVWLVGAEGFAVVPEAGAERIGTSLEWGEVVLTAGGAIEDLGGEVRWLSGDQVHIGSRRSAYQARWPEGQPVAGRAAQAEWVEARAGGELLARLPVDQGSFSGELPSETEELVAVAQGYADSPGAAPAEDLELVLGEPGTLHLRVADETGRSIPALVERDGATWVVPPEGRSLPLGPGTADTLIWAGPGHEAALHPALEVGAASRLDVVLPRVQPGDRLPVLAELDLVGWPDARVREGWSSRLSRAAGRGVRFAVAVARDEVPQDVYREAWTAPQLELRVGSQADTDAYGSPLAWPWSADGTLWAHGAARWPLLDPWQLLSVMDLLSTRNVVLDLAWFEAAGLPPEGFIEALAVRLDGIEQLDAYLALLDRGEQLPPVGPWTWIEGVDEELFSAVEVERSLWRGRTVATNGPGIELRVQGVGPGQVAVLPRLRQGGGAQGDPPAFREQLTVSLRVASPAWAPLDQVALYGPGGQELARFAAREDGSLVAEVLLLEPVGWLLAAAWGEEPSPITGQAAWAVTGPVWVQEP